VRTPTIPEAHLGAVIIAASLAWSWYGFAAWQYPVAAVAAPLVFIPFGVWLRWAWRAVRRERRPGNVPGVAEGPFELPPSTTGRRTMPDLRRTMAAAAEVQGEQAARAFVKAVERGELRHLDEGQE
jgi:hypothetical protein